jgi:hypothetical protein
LGRDAHKSFRKNSDSPRAFKTALELKWYGIYSEMKVCPSVNQINRTLRELWHIGLIVGTRVKQEPFDKGLMYWAVEYQLSSEVYKNWITAECNAVHSKTKRAKFGFTLFGGEPFDQGLPVDEVQALVVQIKSLMQKCHPDKMSGFEAQFKQLQQCKEWIKDGIPTPKQAASRIAKIATRRIKSPV